MPLLTFLAASLTTVTLEVATPDATCRAEVDTNRFLEVVPGESVALSTLGPLVCSDDPADPTDCDDQGAPTDLRKVSTLQITRNSLQSFSASSYAQAWGAWPINPGISGSTNVTSIANDAILSWEFTIPDDANDDYVWFSWVGFSGTAASTRLTISRCPYAIDSPVAEGCIGQGGQAGGGLTFGPNPNANCQLQKGRTYSFVLAHLDVNGDPGCFALGCDWRVQPRRIPGSTR